MKLRKALRAAIVPMVVLAAAALWMCFAQSVAIVTDNGAMQAMPSLWRAKEKARFAAEGKRLSFKVLDSDTLSSPDLLQEALSSLSGKDIVILGTVPSIAARDGDVALPECETYVTAPSAEGFENFTHVLVPDYEDCYAKAYENATAKGLDALMITAERNATTESGAPLKIVIGNTDSAVSSLSEELAKDGVDVVLSRNLGITPQLVSVTDGISFVVQWYYAKAVPKDRLAGWIAPDYLKVIEEGLSTLPGRLVVK